MMKGHSHYAANTPVPNFRAIHFHLFGDLFFLMKTVMLIGNLQLNTLICIQATFLSLFFPPCSSEKFFNSCNLLKKFHVFVSINVAI